MNNNYIPDRGDIVWMSLHPQVGREQRGRRPCLIISTRMYNKIGLCVLVPITSRDKNRNLDIKIPEGHQTKGVILVDHIKSLDWKKRKVEYIETAQQELLAQLNMYLKAFLNL